jgi:ABC-type molybdate transport system substrate-binding protein
MDQSGLLSELVSSPRWTLRQRRTVSRTKKLRGGFVAPADDVRIEFARPIRKWFETRGEDTYISAYVKKPMLCLVLASSAFRFSALAQTAGAQKPNCVPPSNQQVIIYRAGSLTRAFTPLEAAFTCQTGIQVKDVAMGSVDAGRQITAGGRACDLYAPADYLDIDLFMKPAGYANFNIVFAHGKMVLAYSASGLAAKKLPSIAEPDTQLLDALNSIPKAAAKWYEILTMPEVTIGGGNPFLDPGAYRAPMMFQLAEVYYKVPNLYNNLLEHLVIPNPDSLGTALGTQFDFQFTYEHNARATAIANPDFRYVNLPDEINLSNPAKDAYYRQNAIVVLPGLGTSRSARTIAVQGTHLACAIR